jgi:3-methyladenine DNA glycosylase/8-oxoguanine DNA glycosylase
MLQYDPAKAVRHLRRKDAVLREVIKMRGPLSIEPRGGSFRALSRAVLFQQLAGPAARAILRRVLETFDVSEEQWYRPEQFLSATDEQLRAAGLSRQKMTYLRDLAEKFADGTLREDEFGHLDDESVIERVTVVKGIGRWTAEMFLMFTLGRPDVLPVDDLGVRKGMQSVYGLAELPKADEMQRIAEPWRPYRSAGTWYMWRAMELDTLDAQSPARGT